MHPLVLTLTKENLKKMISISTVALASIYNEEKLKVMIGNLEHVTYQFSIISKEVNQLKYSMQIVRCSAIYGISYRYHHCGTICMLEDKDKCRGSSLRMALRIFRCPRALKPMVVSLDTLFGDLRPT
jgi:hypothetical protein